MDALINQVMAPDYDEKKRLFYSYYSDNEKIFHESSDAFANLVKLLVSSNETDGAKVSSRVKNKHECITKFDLKYRQNLEKSGENYAIQDYISDIIGVRIVCLYESQIAIVSEIIKKQFNVIKEENKALDLDEKFRFGYKGLHLDLELNDARRKLPEYNKFSSLRFELQIRSIVQDAWSEVDHRLKYKKQIPDKLKRRIIRLAALFELADQEFEEIRNTTDKTESEVRQSINDDNASSIDEAGEPLDAFNFLAFLSRRYPAYVFEPHKVDGFVDDIKTMDKDITLGDFSKIFNSNFEITQEYREDKRGKGININPYTHVRHMFVAHDKEKFSDMLYPKQKAAFVEWLASRGAG